MSLAAPVGAHTETAAGHDRQVGDTAPTSKREAVRYLRAELGLTGAQAHRLYVAYARDLADARRIGNDTHSSDEGFIDWLMRQAPGTRKPSVRQWRIGEAGWRTAS